MIETSPAFLSIPSKSRTPPPRNVGASDRRSSSTRPAFRYWRTVAPPPLMRTSFSPAASLARCTDLVREDEDLRVERRLLRPGALSLLEHPLAHDVRADAVEDGLEEAIVRSRLTALAELALLANTPLSE